VYLVDHISSLDIKDLHPPTKKQESLLTQAYIENYIESKQNPNVQWFIKDIKAKDRFKGRAFAGTAWKVSKEKNKMYSNDPYGICIASYVLDEEIFEYKMWVLRHELRHCRTIGKQMFRDHDYAFIDEGFDRKIYSGFFNEDFAAVACCDKLMRYFQNLKGIEEHLG
jgi:hypothetical protein